MSPLRDEEPAAITGLVAALDSCAAQLGPFHPETVAVANRLAIAFWNAGELDRAISLLDQALDGLAASAGCELGVRIDVLNTLGQIMLEQADWERASEILEEVLELCVGRYGETHPSSLAAKGDLAVVLFELGREHEAAKLEAEALENARNHLGRKHPVSSVLAWNRALRYEIERDANSAKAIVASDLLWLLTEDDTSLDADQKTIRDMLARRWNWDAASVC